MKIVFHIPTIINYNRRKSNLQENHIISVCATRIDVLVGDEDAEVFCFCKRN